MSETHPAATRRAIGLAVFTGAAALALFRIGMPSAEPLPPVEVPQSITEPELAELYRRRAHRTVVEPVQADAEPPADEEEWETRPGQLAHSAQELTDGQLVSCRVGAANIPDGKGLITSPDPRVRPDEGTHMVVPYVINTQVKGGLLLFNALPETQSVEWVSQSDGARTRITWTPSEDGSPVGCDTVQPLSQRTGVFGTVRLEAPLEGGHVMVSGCGGFEQLGGEGGEFFMEIDSAESCHLQAAIVGLGPVPTTGPAIEIEPAAGSDITGIELTLPAPVTDWPGLARLVLDWSDGATVWWEPEPSDAHSERAGKIQESLNEQADQVFDAVSQAAILLMENEEVLAALQPEELDQLQQIADEVTP